jgi:hypothetical protein
MGEGGLTGASAGPAKADATYLAESLNSMFRMPGLTDTRAAYKCLKQQFPKLLEYVKSKPKKETRQQTLRFAGAMMTGHLKYTGTVKPYPAKKFRVWLKWLSWVHFTPVEEDGVRPIKLTIDKRPAPGGKHQSEAIMEAVKDALEHTNIEEVMFTWTGDTNATNTSVDVTRIPTTPGHFRYEITVVSPQAEEIAHAEFDEDDFPD